MELLYIWIEKDGMIEDAHITFSPEFEFELERNGERFILQIRETNCPNIMKLGNIENVSVIIGNNGSGKTTLMRHLMRGPIYPYSPENSIYREIAVYRRLTDKEHIRIITNIERGRFSYYVSESHDIDVVFSKKGERSHLVSRFYPTRIYLTSGIDAIGLVSTSREELEQVVMSPRTISSLGESFFGYVYQKEMEMDKEHRWYARYNRYLKEHLKSSAFMQICVIVFYNKLLHSEEGFEGYMGNVKKDISLMVISPMRFIMDSENDEWNMDENNRRIYNEIKDVVRSVSEKALMGRQNRNIVDELILALITEIYIYNKIKPHEAFDIHEEWNRIKNNPREVWIYNAIKEIEQLSEILSNDESLNGLLRYENDGRQEEPYNSFCELIHTIVCKQIQANYDGGGSFILKYLSIRNLQMSAGETSFQNIFSWMAVIPELENMMSRIPQMPKHEILLMIDEIDLYSNPNWERQIIQQLIKEISREYDTSYNIQLIVSTQSPLCLSDVPKQNTIFLKRKGDVIMVDNGGHQQSFGRNIYDILNDSFYLDGGTMGYFARDYINGLFNEIDNMDDESDTDIEEISKRISIIGDDFLRERLNAKLMGRRRPSAALKIQILKEEKRIIDERIRELQQYNDNDKA